MSVCHAGWAAYGYFVHELLHDGVVECIDSDQIADVSDELGHRLMVEVVLGQPGGLRHSKSQHPLNLCLLSIHSAHYVAVGESSKSMSGSSLPCWSSWC